MHAQSFQWHAPNDNSVDTVKTSKIWICLCKRFSACCGRWVDRTAPWLCPCPCYLHLATKPQRSSSVAQAREWCRKRTIHTIERLPQILLLGEQKNKRLHITWPSLQDTFITTWKLIIFLKRLLVSSSNITTLHPSFQYITKNEALSCYPHIRHGRRRRQPKVGQSPP